MIAVVQQFSFRFALFHFYFLISIFTTASFQTNSPRNQRQKQIRIASPCRKTHRQITRDHKVTGPDPTTPPNSASISTGHYGASKNFYLYPCPQLKESIAFHDVLEIW